MASRVIRISDDTWRGLQALGHGFTGDDLGTPDKVISKLLADSDARFVLDALGCSTLAEAKAAIDLARLAVEIDADDRVDLAVVDGEAKLVPLGHRSATPAEIAGEQDGVLRSMANGDLDVDETTRHLAQAELDYRAGRR